MPIRPCRIEENAISEQTKKGFFIFGKILLKALWGKGSGAPDAAKCRKMPQNAVLDQVRYL